MDEGDNEWYRGYQWSANVALIFIIINKGMHETVVINTQIPDAWYWILDMQEYSNSEIQKHPVSSNQNPGSVHTDHSFRRSKLVWIEDFMQL